MNTGYNLNELELMIQRYNASCITANLPTLHVDLRDVRNRYEELNTQGGGLFRSLVYSERDLSVYVRSTEECGERVFDVALCTQDFTHRSNMKLGPLTDEDISTPNTVGRSVRELLDAEIFPQLNGIVKALSEERILHRVIRRNKEALITIELARRHVSTDERSEDGWIRRFEGGIDIDEEFGEKPHTRVPLTGEIFHAWLICMTVFRNETSDKTLDGLRNLYLSCLKAYKNPNVDEVKYNVNMENMLRARSKLSQDGRWTWPVVVGLCTARNLTSGISNSRIEREEKYCKALGTYEGRCGWKNVVAILINVILVGSLVSLVVVGVQLEWPGSVTSVAAVIFGLS